VGLARAAGALAPRLSRIVRHLVNVFLRAARTASFRRPRDRLFVQPVFLHRFDTPAAMIITVSDRSKEATMDILALGIAWLFFVISIWLFTALERL